MNEQKKWNKKRSRWICSSFTDATSTVKMFVAIANEFPLSMIWTSKTAPRNVRIITLIRHFIWRCYFLSSLNVPAREVQIIHFSSGFLMDYAFVRSDRLRFVNLLEFGWITKRLQLKVGDLRMQTASTKPINQAKHTLKLYHLNAGLSVTITRTYVYAHCLHHSES